MKDRSSILSAAAMGAGTGLVILGFGGFLVAYALAAGYRVPLEPITLRRLLEPVLLGTFAGGVFALPLVALHRYIPEKPLPRILVIGMTPFVLSLLLLFLRRPPATFSWQLIVTPSIVLLVFLVYGLGH